jgi:hypothetical protein
MNMCFSREFLAFMRFKRRSDPIANHKKIAADDF